MSTLTSTSTLTRFALRRDRVRLTAWVLGIGVAMVVLTNATASMFTTEDERAARLAASENPTSIIFAGPGIGLENLTIGPIVLAETLMVLLIITAILNVMVVVRHTRADEEAGRTELLRADVVGRSATLTAALVHMAAFNAAIGIVTAVGYLSADLAAVDSIALGASMALTGLVFAGVAAVTAQIVEYGRAATGLALAVVGVAFATRAIGDIAESGGSWLSWLSPFAWSFQMRPYADLRLWPLALFALAFVVIVALAYWLASRRDFGAGIVAARPGRQAATRFLASPFALMARLQRTAIIAWSIGVLLLSVSFGAVASSLDDFVESSPEVAQMLGDADLVTGFLSFVALYIVMAASAWGIVSVSRMKAEESAGRTESVLATATSRTRTLVSAWALAAGSSVVILLLGGLGLGLGAALDLGEASWIATGLQAGAAQIPVPLAFASLAALAYAWSVRAMFAVWTWLGIGVLISFFGALFELPDWAMRISPFEMIGTVPADDASVVAISALVLGAALALTAALAAFRQRDLTTE